MPEPINERVLRGRLGAYTSWANTPDRAARTAPARAAHDAKFLAESDGDPLRAEALRKAYFTRLALRSAQSRRRATALTETAAAADAELRDLADGA